MLALGLLAIGAPRAQAQADAPPAPPPAPWRQVVRDFAAKHFANPAWGYSHSARDYDLARSLAATDHVNLDDDVLFAAAYLHDMAAFAPWRDDKLEHGDVAAGLIDTVLKGTDFPMAKIDAVRAAIRTHMYYRDPVAPEALYLHDADALDWLGAIGVARILALVDPNGGHPTGPEAIKMIENNLSTVPAKVFSRAGRAQVAPREAEEELFLKALRAETDNLATL
jgi:HD superfamily phosphodiesterase